MRTLSRLLLGAGLLLAATPNARTDDAGAARAVVERAVRVHGGADRLAKTQLMTITSAGNLSLAEMQLPFSADTTVQFPDRLRLTLEVGETGNKSRTVVVITEDKGWQSAGGVTMEVDKPRLDELKAETYRLWLTTLVPLLKEDGFTLATVPEAKVDGQAARGVKVSRKGRPDVTLYFDKDSGLLVKTEHRGLLGGFEATKETIYRDYKPVEGVRLPTKSEELANGRKQTDVSAYTYKFLSRVDDGTFAKP